MPAIYWTKHFCLILSYKCSRKFAVRGQKLAIVERAFHNEVVDVGEGYSHNWCKANKIPYRIDARSKLVKRIIKVWPEVRHGGRSYTWRRRRLLGYVRAKLPPTRPYATHEYVKGEAYVLIDKLEQLWPLHFMAKEVKFEGFFQVQNAQD